MRGRRAASAEAGPWRISAIGGGRLRGHRLDPKELIRKRRIARDLVLLEKRPRLLERARCDQKLRLRRHEWLGADPVRETERLWIEPAASKCTILIEVTSARVPVDIHSYAPGRGRNPLQIREDGHQAVVDAPVNSKPQIEGENADDHDRGHAQTGFPTGHLGRRRPYQHAGGQANERYGAERVQPE